MVETTKMTTSSSHLNAREVLWWQAVKMVEETTSSSRLDVREVVVVADGGNDHLQLAFGCAGGGGGGRPSKGSKKPPPARV